MRQRIAVAIIFSVLGPGVGVGTAVAASGASKLNISIGPQPLTPALQAFSAQTGLQVGFASRLTQNVLTRGTHGAKTTEEALRELLEGTELRYSFANEQTVVIRAKDDDSIGWLGSFNQSSFGSRVRLAQAYDADGRMVSAIDSSEDRKSPAAASTGSSSSFELEEIVVTAQKREERLQDVPIPVTVISGAQLVSNNQTRLQDFFAQIPGVNYSTAEGPPNIAIRGLTTSSMSGAEVNPTVAFLVDDVPYGGSGYYGSMVPDIDPGDLARIEVLRGPQGTLYGTSSIGGLIKYVTVDPSTDRVSGTIQGGLSDVSHGADLGYSARGAINLPLGETMAVRVSAFKRHDPGYVDAPSFAFDPTHHKEGVNSRDSTGGRFSALWKPSDDFSLKLGALVQDSELNGESYSVKGTLDQVGTLRGTNGNEVKSQVYSAVINAGLGSAELTSVSSFTIAELLVNRDHTQFYGFLNSYGVSGVARPQNAKTEKFSQEFRLQMPLGDRFNWLMGGFYTHEATNAFVSFDAVDPVSLEKAGELLEGSIDQRYSEVALFTDLTWQVSDRFDVQIGGRQTRMKQSEGTSLTIFPAFFGAGNGIPTVSPKEERDPDSVFTYLLTPRFKLSPDLMMYARFASGYRIGGGGYGTGPQSVCVLFDFPCEYGPDKTLNYELGMKGDFLDGLLAVDTSIYRIDWKDIQVQGLAPPTFSFTENGGKAKSQGVELSVTAHPVKGMTFSGWVAWCDAKLTQDFPPGSTIPGRNGDRLPGSSPFSGYLSLNQEFALPANLTGFAGAAVTYVGERGGSFRLGPNSPTRLVEPSYTRMDLTGGVKKDSWTANVFVNNVANKRAVVGYYQYSAGANNVIYLQPRTVGLSASKSF